MTTDALLALRPCEVVPEETIREWLHAVQQDLDRLDSAVRQAEADADEAERRLRAAGVTTDGGEYFESALRRSLEQLVASTEAELRAALDDAHRGASLRIAEARAARDMPSAPPVLAVVKEAPSADNRAAYEELREIASRILEPHATVVPPPPPSPPPPSVDAVAAVDVVGTGPKPSLDSALGPDVATASVEAVHEAFWSESEAATTDRSAFRTLVSTAALPMLAAVLLLVALLLLLG